MKARDMFFHSIRYAGMANRAGVRLERKFDKAIKYLVAAKIGTSIAKPKRSDSEELSQLDLGGCSPEIVEEFNANGGETLCGPGSRVRFDNLVFPLSTEKFFAAQYPQPRPMLFRGNTERFRSLVEWRDLDEIVCGGQLKASKIKLFMGGAQLPDELYAMTSYGTGDRQRDSDAAMIDGHKLISLLRQGATLVVDEAHRAVPSVGNLAGAFEVDLHSYAYVNLYASWCSTPGFGTHWDDHDVFVVQVRGEKLWQVYGPTRNFPTKLDIVLEDSAPKSPIWKGILTAGDMFYVPRGWWHDAQVPATSQGRGSIHLTCQVRTLTGQDVLVWLGSKLGQYEQFRKDVPFMAHESQLEDYLEEFKNLVFSTLADRSAQELKNDFRNRWMERPATSFGPWIEPWNSPEWNRYCIVLRGLDQAHLDRDDEEDSISLTANGWTHMFDPRCKELIEVLCESEGVTVASLRSMYSDVFSVEFVDDFIKLLISKSIVVAVPPHA